MSEQAANKQTLGFQTEVKQLLHLMVHALYSNKEIFLRELISNASDAADKLRYEALAGPGLYEGDSNLAIHVEIEKEARTLTIRDNGIGMSRDEVIQHLGTIAKSGTKEFLAGLSNDQAKNANMIGQFGVGFYSAFIVADKVTVLTRRAGVLADQGVRWESAGEGEYTIETINKPKRGTEVILHLKEDCDEFLESWRIRSIITKYSDHIMLPIMMHKLEDLSETKEEKTEETKEEQTKKAVEWEQVNKATALWTLPKSKIKDEEYKELYKHIAHDFEEPLCWAHNKVEGNLSYTSLLYVPAHAPFDLFNRERPRGLKLYVKRVFIMDEAEQFLPLYLRFIKGIVDSDDLPLNISREILQDNKTITSMRSALVKRVLDMLEKLAADDKEAYRKFWREFGKVLKEGPAEDFANREKIASLLRFASTHRDSEEQDISLSDYVSRMQPGQDKIYYITAENYAAAKSSPNLEIFKAKKIEVLLLTDRIDEWLVSSLPEFNNKKLQSVAQGDLDLSELGDTESKEKQEQTKQEFQSITDRVKKVLGEKVKEVRVTQRLTSSPACVVTSDYEMNLHVQQLLKAAGQAVPEVKPILELNPEHNIVKKLKDEVDEDRFADWANILLDQAILADGGQLHDPAHFVQRLNNLLLELAR